MIGRTLGHHEILDRLGAGGMGEVYLAHDLELDRKVALKVLPEELAADAERLDRFKREARTLASLNHPNIVTIFSVESATLKDEGSYPKKIHFLTMELVEGRTLSELTPKQGMRFEQILELSIPIAEGLAEAHDKGIVHRDLKPGNIMVADSGRVKVLDFGLAKAWQEAAPEMSTAVATEPMTMEGQVVGTVPYMSPEQLEGKPLDGRSDIFSLGVILYEMATGNRPFRGQTALSVISAILKDDPEDVDSCREDLPRHLGRIIRHSLEKAPDQRFQSMRDVRNQLEDLRREDSTESRGVVTDRPPQTGQGMRWMFAAALIAGVALLGFFGSRLIESDKGAAITPEVVESASGRKMIVVLPFENLGEPEDKYFADGMTEEITSRLATLQDLGVISRTSALQYAEGRPSLAQIGKELGVGYVLEGTVRWQRSDDGTSQVRVTPQLIRVSDDTHLWVEQYDARLENIFDVQSNIAHRVSDELGLALLDTEIESLNAKPTKSLEAYDFFLQGNEYLTRGMEINRPRDVEIAIEMYAKAARLDEDFALAQARMGTAHSWLYSEYFDRSDARLAKARASVGIAIDLQPDLPEAHQALAGIYHVERQMTQALLEYQTVLERQPSNAEVLESLAWVQTDLGLWEESLETLKRAMMLNPRLGRLACWAGGRCFGMRDFENAMTYHDRAIHLTPDRSCPYACQTWIFMNWDGETDRARRVLEEIPNQMDMEGWPPLNYPWFTVEIMEGNFAAALEILDRGTKEAYEFRAFYIPKDLLRAQVYELMGEREGGRAFYESARDHLLSKIERQPEDARLRSALGIAYAGLGEREAAIREGELGVDLLLGSQAETLGYILKDLAQIYTMLGDRDKALDQLQRLLSRPALFAVGYFQLDPTFQSLRSETRFQDLIRKYQTKTEHA